MNITQRQRQLQTPQSQYGLSRLFDLSFSSSRNLSFNQSLMCESSSHTLKSYAPHLPVIVLEALSSEILPSSLSVKISDSGWAWLVCGRRLFVWKYKQSQSQSLSSCPCYELQLPPSDLAHKADLVCVFTAKDHHQSHQIPSTIAVSPEGIIRYWPNIAYDGHSIETTASDLQGQECSQLTDIQSLGCILGTTTSTLVHVTINNVDGQNSISCRTLKVPQGMLAGISKKVSSFIFGAMPASHSPETKQLIKIVGETLIASSDYEADTFIWVLAGNSVQKWQMMDEFSERLIDEFDIERPVRDAFLDRVWNRETTHPNQLQIWPIDIAIRKPNEIVVLVAGLNVDVSNQLFYAIAILTSNLLNSPSSMNSVRGSTMPIQFTSFKILRNHTVCYSEEDEEQLLSLHLLTGTANDQAVYLYNHNRVLCVVLASDEVDVIDINNRDDGILGAGVCEGLPLIFTRKNALISIVPHLTDTREVMNAVQIDDSVDNDEENLVGALKRAFILFMKGENARSQKLVASIIQLTNDSDNKIDGHVIELSAQLCDEIPRSDPRWAESATGQSASATASKIIAAQLDDKLNSHKLFIEFLKANNIWDRLTTVMSGGSALSTHLCLCDDAEKIISTMKLKLLHDQQQYSFLVDAVIKMVLLDRGVSADARLTDEDLFYRETTKINDFVVALLNFEHEQINNVLSQPKKILHLIVTVSQILIEMFKEVCVYRMHHGSLYNSTAICKHEYMPWTCRGGSNGIRTLLTKQFEVLVNLGVESMSMTSAIEDDTELKGIIHQSILELADVILDGFLCQLKSIDASNERYKIVERNYESIRSKCLEPLMKARQFDRAATLAEKYQDFEVLIRICEALDNQQRLQRYMQEFSNKAFAQFLFNWYMKEGKQSKMLMNTANNPQLGDFLRDHQQLNWIHHIHLGQYEAASRTLKQLAFRESQYLARKKTLLSLSKLAALVVDDGTVDISDVNEELRLINEKETPADDYDQMTMDQTQ